MDKVIQQKEVIPTLPSKSIGVLGANFCFGQKHGGVEQAADLFRAYDLERFLGFFFPRVVDFGNVNQINTRLHEINPKVILANMQRLYKACLKCLDQSDVSLFIGGDHSVGLATVAAVKAKSPNAIVVWVDAHADINTPSQSETKSFHGMPMSFLSGLVNEPEFAGFNSQLMGCVGRNDVIYMGVRELDEPEKHNLSATGFHVHTATDIKSFGASELLKKSLAHLDPYGERPIHVSFDIDAMDPKYASCTGVPVEGGLSLADVNQLGWVLQETGRVKSLDFVELNPELASSQVDLQQSMCALFHLVGGLFPYQDHYERSLQSCIQ